MAHFGSHSLDRHNCLLISYCPIDEYKCIQCYSVLLRKLFAKVQNLFSIVQDLGGVTLPYHPIANIKLKHSM